MLLDPQIYTSMQNRLKFLETPEFKQLLASDENLIKLLQKPTLTHDQKQKFFSEALAQYGSAQDIYKQQVKKPTEVKLSTSDIQPGVAQFNSVSSLQPKEEEASISQQLENISRLKSTSSPVSASSIPSNFGTPTGLPVSEIPPRANGHESVAQRLFNPSQPTSSSTTTTTTSGLPSITEKIIEGMPTHKKQASRKVLDALTSAPSVTIDPHSLVINIDGKPVEDLNVVDFLKHIEHSKQSLEIPAGTDRILKLLGQETGLQPGAILSPTMRHRMEMYHRGEQNGSEFAKFWSSVSDTGKALRSGKERKQ